jgi:DNA (cytosine-5)-methyltransferase 1
MARSSVRPRPEIQHTAIDLFCGAGGFTLGLQRAGFSVRLAVDSWDQAIGSYQSNFSHLALCQDVHALTGRKLLKASGLEPGGLDLLVGGPPCQGFSIQRVGTDVDDRNALVLEYARLVCQARPRYFIMENVPGLLGQRGRALFARFKERLSGEGYEMESSVLNAADFGVPQLRKRVFVLGWLQGNSRAQFPAPTHAPANYCTVDEALEGLPPAAAPTDATPGDRLHQQSRMSDLNLKRLRHIPPGGGMESLPVSLRVNCHKAGASKIGHRYVYGRLAGDCPAGTITARFDSFTRGKFAHPHLDRNITLREGARLQTFPDSFVFLGSREDIAAQIGNAVPPDLATAVADSVRRALSGSLGGKRNSPVASRQ